MGNLSVFLAENATPAQNVKYAASVRFAENGKPVEWEIRAISGAEDEELRRACATRMMLPGQKNRYQTETDMSLYLGKLAAACTVFPNLRDKELQDSYHVRGADDLLKVMLTSGEYAAYLAKVQDVCGFELALESEIAEAKN